MLGCSDVKCVSINLGALGCAFIDPSVKGLFLKDSVACWINKNFLT